MKAQQVLGLEQRVPTGIGGVNMDKKIEEIDAQLKRVISMLNEITLKVDRIDNYQTKLLEISCDNQQSDLDLVEGLMNAIRNANLIK